MRHRVLPALPALTLLAMLGPVAAGLWGTVMPAFGHLPAAGLTGAGLRPACHREEARPTCASAAARDYPDWRETCAALHLYRQIVG